MSFKSQLICCLPACVLNISLTSLRPCPHPITSAYIALLPRLSLVFPLLPTADYAQHEMGFKEKMESLHDPSSVRPGEDFLVPR